MYLPGHAGCLTMTWEWLTSDSTEVDSVFWLLC
jgi:hypothetical protein